MAAAGAANLTTRFLFKQHAGIAAATTTWDNFLDDLIEQVCAQVEKACDRTFLSTTYRQWLDGRGAEELLLPQYPVATVNRVSPYARSIMTVKFSGGGEHADIGFDGTNFRLHSVDGAGAETETLKPVATSKVMMTLAGVINGVSGWACTLATADEGFPSALIRPCAGRWALTPDDATIEYPDEPVDVEISPTSERAIRRVDGAVFPSGRANIFCWYTAGYALPDDESGHASVNTHGTLPKGLTLVVNRICKAVFDLASTSSGVQSETMGAYSYSLGSAAPASLVTDCVNAFAGELHPYMKLAI